MKSIILFICILICINTNAQQKNAKGEKIVTSVEVENYSQKGNLYEKSTIIYKYYDYNKLISINKHTIMAIGEDIRKTNDKDSFNVSLTLKGNILTRTVPKFDFLEGMKYEYTLNSNGTIRMLKKRMPGSYIKYDYGYDDEGKLVDYCCEWYVKHGKEYRPIDKKDSIVFTWIDGNMYYKRCHFEYSDDINDTNLNLSLFLMENGNLTSDNSDGFDYSSKWYEMKSKNLLKYV